MTSHNDNSDRAYRPSCGQILALLRNGMPVPLRPVCFTNITAYLNECRYYKELYLSKRTAASSPPSAIDQHLLAQFGHKVTTQRQSFLAWKRIRQDNMFDFELQYLVHCELVRSYRITGCCLGINWNQVVRQHKICTRQGLFQYHLKKYGFKFQQQGGLRLYLEWQPMLSSKTAQGHLHHKMTHPSPPPPVAHFFSHDPPQMQMFVNDFQTKIPSFVSLFDYITFWENGKSSEDKGIYIYCLLAVHHPSPSPPRMYVGQTSNLSRRLAAHKVKPPLKIRRYLSTNNTTFEQAFHLYLLDYSTSKTDADDMESHYINYYSAQSKGFNSLNGRPGRDKVFWASSKSKLYTRDTTTTSTPTTRHRK